MSEYITHIAILEDTARLAIHSDEICDAFKLCFSEHAIAARMGSASRGNSTFLVQNLQHYRKRWEGRKSEDRLEDKLAYTLGWITHRAADRYFKPRYGIFDKNPENLHPLDARILHDAVLYDKVYGRGTKEPFSRYYAQRNMEGHPASSAFSINQLEALFGPLYQAEMLSLQSFDDISSGQQFLERIEEQFATFTVDFNRLIEALNNPDSEEMKQMIVDSNFYNEDDPIVKTARNLQEGKSVQAEVGDMMDTEKQSQYAQVLAQSYDWIRKGSQYFDKSKNLGEADLFDTYLIVDIHQIERY